MANNEPWDRLEGKAFDFIQVPPRSVKPRERGLTVVADKGLSVRGLEDLIEVAGDCSEMAFQQGVHGLYYDEA